MEEKIKSENVLSNLIWRFGEKTGIQIVSFIVSITIARFIEPEAYGIVALVNVVIDILDVFVDSGLANALIQKKNPDELDYGTVFIANLTICGIIYFLLFISAPFIAKFYEMPSMEVLIRVSGISLLVSGIKDVQHAYIAKGMMYKKFFFASLTGTIIAGIVGVVMAIKGFGAWALIASNITDVIIDCMVITITIKWRPKIQFSLERFKILFNFGYKLLLNRLIGVGYNKMYQFIIGKYYSASDLAYFDKGQNFPNKIINNIDYSINSVMKPVLSKSQDNHEETKKVMKRMLCTSTYVMTPMLVGIFVVSKPLVLFLLTEKWIEAVPYIRIMCFANLLIPIYNANENVARALGRSDLILKYSTIERIIGILVLIFMYPFGVKAMAYGVILTNLINVILNARITKELIDYSFFEQLKDIANNVVMSVFMGLLVYLLSFLINNNTILLFTQISLGITIFLFMSIITKNKSYKYILLNIKKLIIKK